MTRYNLWLLTAALGFGLDLVAGAPALRTGPEPEPPGIDARDQRFLSRLARRAYEQYLLDGTVYSTPYTPSSLAEIECYMVVTLRSDLHRSGRGTSGPGPIARTTVEATLAALQDAERSELQLPADSTTVLIEMEAIGDEQPITFQGDWFKPGVIERLVEPVVDGLTVRAGGRARRVCPSEWAATNQTLSDALKRIVESLGRPPEELTLWRFRTKHWYQARPNADIVSLRRGLVPVTPHDVTQSSVNDAIERIAASLIHRRRPSGFFAYEYEPAVNDYTSKDDPVHQAGAAWALAEYAATAQSPDVLAVADRAIQAHIGRMRSIPGVDGAACVTSADQKNKLGLTAQVYLAMSAGPFRERYTGDLARMATGILWLQQSSGEFITAFPPARRLTGFDDYPSVALLALLADYRRTPNQNLLEAFNRAFAFYRTAFEKRPTVTAAAWLQQPFARMAVLSNRKEFARIAFQLADWLIERQLTPSNCRWPELHGGVTKNDQSLPDITTAICLSGWIDCLLAARRFKESEHAKTYELAAQRAARFVMQLQVRESETFLMGVAQDVVGAVRTSPADNRLPLENMQYALLALMKYRDAMNAGK